MKRFAIRYRHRSVLGNAVIVAPTRTLAIAQFKHTHPGAWIETVHAL